MEGTREQGGSLGEMGRGGQRGGEGEKREGVAARVRGGEVAPPPPWPATLMGLEASPWWVSRRWPVAQVAGKSRRTPSLFLIRRFSQINNLPIK